MCKVGDINLSYECLTSYEVRQAIIGLRSTDVMLYEKLSTPSSSAPIPPPSPQHDGSYPEDQERDDDDTFVDSSLSIDEMIAWISSEAPGGVVDSSDDEEIDGFGHDDSCGPKNTLEPFDARFATSSWTRWDGTA